MICVFLKLVEIEVEGELERLVLELFDSEMEWGKLRMVQTIQVHSFPYQFNS